jgi:hypothetical protein
MMLSKEQEEWLDKVSTGEIRWRYGQPLIDNFFKDMPKELVTEEFCLAVVQKNGHYLLIIPVELKTETVCLAAVQKGSLELWRVPEELRTEAICIAAVKQDAHALQYVPKKLQSKAKAALNN